MFTDNITRARFVSLRKRLFNAIDVALRQDCGKSYEGFMTVTEEYADYYDDPKADGRPNRVCIHLDCYIVGPHRHYDWVGKTFAEAFAKCERDIESWIKEERGNE